MQKPISRKLHGAADYLYAPMAAAAPELFGFSQNATATRLARVIGTATMGQTILTDAEWGAVKVIPFRQHLMGDLLLGAFTMAAPWLFGFSNNKKARNAFLGLGATALATAAMTQADNRIPYANELAQGTSDDLEQLSDNRVDESTFASVNHVGDNGRSGSRSFDL